MRYKPDQPPAATEPEEGASQEVSRKHRRNLAVFALQAALSVNLAYFSLREINWGALGRMVSCQSAAFFAVALPMSVLITLLYAFRWQEVLRGMGHSIQLSLLSRQVFVGIFFNNFTPSMLGQDATKTYYLGRDTGYVTAGVSVIVDKILGLTGLTVLGTALIPALGLTGPLYAGTFTASLCFALACIAAVVCARLPMERFIPPFLSRFPLGRKIADLITRSRIQASSALPLRVLAMSLLIILASMSIQAVLYSWFLTAATGTSPSLVQLVGVLCLATTVTNMPVSVNGIGVREQAHTVLLAALGVPAEAAVGLSLLQYVLLLAQSILGWGLWLTRPSMRAPATGGDRE